MGEEITRKEGAPGNFNDYVEDLIKSKLGKLKKSDKNKKDKKDKKKNNKVDQIKDLLDFEIIGNTSTYENRILSKDFNGTYGGWDTL